LAAIVEIKNLSKTYRNGAMTIVFKDAAYSFPASKVIGLFAPSGYGKSTLIFLVAGLEKPDSGRVIVAGNDVTRMNEKSLAIFRRKNIGIVFQFFNLIPTLTAIENVMLPMRLIGTKFQDAIKKPRGCSKMLVLRRSTTINSQVNLVEDNNRGLLSQEL